MSTEGAGVESTIRSRIRGDRQALTDLALLLGNLESPHGEERAAAEYVVSWLEESGIESWLQPITSTSANAVGRIRGRGRGRSLILDAHLDTGSPLSPRASERERRIAGAWVEGDKIYGKGVINDKGQLACFMIALRAIAQSGVELAGDAVLAGVAYETGAPSVGDRQGIAAPGEGFGTWWLVNRGITADYALVGETSDFGLIVAECGSVFVEVSLTGRHIYTPRLGRREHLADHPGSVLPMASALMAIEAWAREYEEKAEVDFWGGEIRPRVQIMSVDASLSRSVAQVDIRLAPGASPHQTVRSLQDYLQGQGVTCMVQPFQWSRGYIAEGAEGLIEAVTKSHVAVFDAQPSAPSAPETSMWRDINFFNEVGIPSICYGPARQREDFSDVGNRSMLVDDLVKASEVYALTVLEICGPAGT